jgi:hypothetical protein
MRKHLENTLVITNLVMVEDLLLHTQEEIKGIDQEARGVETAETDIPETDMIGIEDRNLIPEEIEVMDTEIETVRETEEIDIIAPDLMKNIEAIADPDHQGESKAQLHSSVQFYI